MKWLLNNHSVQLNVEQLKKWSYLVWFHFSSEPWQLGTEKIWMKTKLNKTVKIMMIDQSNEFFFWTILDRRNFPFHKHQTPNWQLKKIQYLQNNNFQMIEWMNETIAHKLVCWLVGKKINSSSKFNFTISYWILQPYGHVCLLCLFYLFDEHCEWFRKTKHFAMKYNKKQINNYR